MKEIDFVLENYLPSSSTIVAGYAQRRKVIGGAPKPVDVVIETDLPEKLSQALSKEGRDLSTSRLR